MPVAAASPVSDLTQDGYARVENLLSADALSSLCRALEEARDAVSVSDSSGSRRGGSLYALRNVLTIPEVVEVIGLPVIRTLVADVLGGEAFAVRGIFFDKTPEANWPVPWHQDLSIAVRERRDAPGWGPWSEKAGVTHVQPPPEILEQILTVRLHLDDCPAENGALRVLPGTHRLGRLDAAEIARLRATTPEAVCAARPGDALLMRPLLLHASSSSQQPGHRRVLHVEFAAGDLPHGLAWAARTV
jgi:ectoine hydroxylase-related dioxygenase (phytanoyl-CoA dioxygenase family)